MGRIKELFDNRTKTYNELSNQIIEALSPHVLSAAVEVLELTSDETNRLEWYHLQLVQGYVVLVGSVVYREGEIVTKDGESIVLTEELAYLMGKYIRLSVPLELAEKGTKEEIIESLRSTSEELRRSYQSSYDGADADYSDDDMFHMTDVVTGVEFTTDDEFEINDYSGTAVLHDDFDYSGLTDEQIESLELSQITQKRGKLN